MAVRHGYGKTAGADALVFAYDTGDTRNSYKGEPTTNLQPTGGAEVHDSNSGNVVTVTDATAEKGAGWKKVAITARGTNFRTLQFTYTSMVSDTMYTHSAVFDWGNMRDNGYFIYFDGNGTGVRNYYRPGDYVNTASGNIDSSMPDGKFAANITHTASHSHALFIGNYTLNQSGLNHYFYYKEYQVEVNSHPTQFTAGTRSATQGLLDLTGNTTLNLTNVSFDSSAYPTWDGTDDSISMTGFTQLSDPNNFSVEAIVKLYAHNSNTNIGSVIVNNYQSLKGWIFYLDGPDSRLGLRHHNDGNPGGYSIEHGTGINLDQWYYIAATDDGTTVRLYINGTQVTSGASATSVNYTGQPLIGQFGGNNAVTDGDIPVVKIYSRALTAAEVKNNFNNYKGRFNL